MKKKIEREIDMECGGRDDRDDGLLVKLIHKYICLKRNLFFVCIGIKSSAKIKYCFETTQNYVINTIWLNLKFHKKVTLRSHIETPLNLRKIKQL